MRSDHDPFELSFLQKLDLYMATRLVGDGASAPAVRALTEGSPLPPAPSVDVKEWISSVLSLRGLLVHPEDVHGVLRHRGTRYRDMQHEHAMIRGLYRVFRQMRKRATLGKAPDGWHLVESFKMFTRGIARFRNNQLRRDMPWDAILYVQYPDTETVRRMLDDFTLDLCYRDNQIRFQTLHPVRQAFRVMWKFARIAPFPDFNLVMAFVAMSEYLLYRGYPLFCPEPEDRALLHRLVSGPIPNRVMRFESRLLGRIAQAV